MSQKNVRSCEELLLELKEKIKVNYSRKLKLKLENDDIRDIYNITAPFEFTGEKLIAGRVESRDREESEVRFFRQKEDEWVVKEDVEALQLQDPFVTFIGDELILGGVEIFDDPYKPGTYSWRTIFYRGTTWKNLKRFAKGSDRMKDIRIHSLKDGHILVLTRPQGAIGGRGMIGYTILSGLEELDEENIEKAVLFEHQFLNEEWGGANEIHELANGKIGILSHIACYDKDANRHYYSTCFCFNYKTGAYSPMKMIACRDDFEKGPSKRPDLTDVIFSGGLIRQNNGKAQLYCGVSDAEGHMIEIDDPFLEYEQ